MGEIDVAKRRFHMPLWAALVALVIISVFGYTIGKDRALRDNARDRAAQEAAS
jgi:hypothetical protein